MPSEKIQRTIIRDTDRPPTRKTRYSMTRLQQLIADQGNRCAICRENNPLQSYYAEGRIAVAAVCRRCAELAKLTVDELRTRTLEARTQARILEAVAEWRTRRSPSQ